MVVKVFVVNNVHAVYVLIDHYKHQHALNKQRFKQVLYALPVGSLETCREKEVLKSVFSTEQRYNFFEFF